MCLSVLVVSPLTGDRQTDKQLTRLRTMSVSLTLITDSFIVVLCFQTSLQVVNLMVFSDSHTDKDTENVYYIKV